MIFPKNCDILNFHLNFVLLTFNFMKYRLPFALYNSGIISKLYYFVIFSFLFSQGIKKAFNKIKLLNFFVIFVVFWYLTHILYALRCHYHSYPNQFLNSILLRGRNYPRFKECKMLEDKKGNMENL